MSHQHAGSGLFAGLSANFHRESCAMQTPSVECLSVGKYFTGSPERLGSTSCGDRLRGLWTAALNSANFHDAELLAIIGSSER